MSPSRLKTTTMDILELNSRIQKFIDDESINNTENQKIIFQINTLLSGEFNLRPRMINKLNCLKESLKTSVEEYYNLKYFNVDVAPLIEKYHTLNNQVVIIPFFNTNKKHLKEHAIKKEVIQKEFIQKLKDYTSLKNFEFMMKNYAFVPRSSPPPCLCGNKTEFIRDEDRAVCAICSTEQSLISNTSSFSDVGRVNMASKYTYNRKVHFRDCIIQYQGKQKTHIPEEIYTILEVKLMEKKIINNEYNDRLKRFEKVTRIMVLDILKELESKDIKKFYDDIVLIHHTLTGQPCDNIEYLEDSLLDDFDKLTETYDNLYTNDSVEEEGSKNKISKRKNFINAQFVLYQLLRKHGHPCNEMDFLTLKTSERKRFHHTICKELFNILGWKYSFSI
ncbi:DNA binding/packing protein [Invertebrate iridescent virus 22]|uniref:DNA binding/packing protein n=1 Tax=Invertebrate iridescent virus 22 TaxID=345198 RepID=W8W1E8_9VIRU|nr:DNA binding/packing protein [Invertebrate iridescent virus 22]CCV01982.1 DNA binding/packing protein [Invertebrate iridescent virus 22]